jgi:hypothetical protein
MGLSQVNAAHPTRWERSVAVVRVLVVLALTLSLVWGVVGTLHWPIVGDAPLMHYVAFLLDHGKAPYREIVDINLPGTYALEWGAIHFLGPGAAAWRVFDLGLLAVCLGAMVWMTASLDWLAGFFAGTLFALVHLRDGPTHTGQRDLMMATMLMLATACLCRAVQPARVPKGEGPGAPTVWAGLFGLFVGAAATIKPSGMLFAVGLGVMLWVGLRREPTRFRFLAIALVGFAAPVVAATVWLLKLGALGAFVETMRGLAAYHASLGRPWLGALAVGSFPSVLLAVAVPALALLVAQRAWRGWQVQVLLLGAALGAASYIMQGKGFPYHRYPEEAFLMLLCGTLLVGRLQSAGWLRWMALAGMLLGALWLAPNSAWIACHYDWRNQEFNRSLEADLTRLQGLSSVDLDGRIQCVDMTSGCLNTLYNMGVVQSTGYLYDCYLFQPVQTPVSEAYRAGFWRAIEETKPAVFVVTDQECFSMARSWAQPQRWPEFSGMLQSDYVLEKQFTPPHTVAWWRKPAVPYSYRVYVRKDRP